MPSLTDEIKHLRDRIKQLENDLTTFYVETKNLTSNNSAEIKAKKQELKDIRSKLQDCQQEKEKIQKELDEKVEELENSNLASEEKSQQIIKLLTESKKELDLMTKELIKTWSNYNLQSDRIINHLTQPCVACQDKEKMANDLVQVRNWLIGVVSLLLILLSRSWLPKKHQKKFKK